jgi:hypothetical protein
VDDDPFPHPTDDMALRLPPLGSPHEIWWEGERRAFNRANETSK